MIIPNNQQYILISRDNDTRHHSNADAGGDAGEVEENEEHEGKGDEWCHATGGDVAMIEHCHGACHNLFGSDTCNEGDSLKG